MENKIVTYRVKVPAVVVKELDNGFWLLRGQDGKETKAHVLDIELADINLSFK